MYKLFDKADNASYKGRSGRPAIKRRRLPIYTTHAILPSSCARACACAGSSVGPRMKAKIKSNVNLTGGDRAVGSCGRCCPRRSPAHAGQGLTISDRLPLGTTASPSGDCWRQSSDSAQFNLWQRRRTLIALFMVGRYVGRYGIHYDRTGWNRRTAFTVRRR